MIAVMNIPKMEVAPASAAAAAEGFPEHMGALSVGIDHGYGKVEDVREQHAKGRRPPPDAVAYRRRTRVNVIELKKRVPITFCVARSGAAIS